MYVVMTVSVVAIGASVSLPLLVNSVACGNIRFIEPIEEWNS